MNLQTLEGHTMLNGYKTNPWDERTKHLYVPSSRNFSQLLNYDLAVIMPAVTLGPAAFITGIALLCNSVLLAGLIVLAFGIFLPILTMFGYKGSRNMHRYEYDDWLDVEKSYARMSKADRKRHKDTLTKAFYNKQARWLAEEIFEELDATDFSDLESELANIREHKKILAELKTQ